MKFIVDAQLPFSIALFLKDKGFDVLHTNDMPDKERTTDNQIRRIATLENRIVITKDYDFFDSYIIKKVPKKLLLVTTGNIKNQKLLELWQKNWEQIVNLFKTYDFVELNKIDVIAK